ncbi:oligosaccharide flippase family protein [Vibrio hippocampi]|uniref:Lipopolysaccharide biosynthesis protein WzxC n=1 Tax=Vibrio hippocampi TaxID=654686 RepID=A0ABM8ZL83_9VIBR|nr:oligosaccharide flippase family protein [Vibrio hippocampi]CAH0529080.1 Lipopolysaccharide biosynthesis protein WzxC [Vibrio hippocampi]
MLRERLAKLIWIFIEKFGMIFLSIISFYVLASQLTPKQLGLGVLAIAAVEAIAVLINAALEGPYVCAEKTDKKTDGSFFWTSIILAVLGQLLVIGITWLVTSDMFFLILVSVASLKILMSIGARVYIANMRREGQFKSIAIRTIFGKVLGTIAGITMAIYGGGAWAIVIQGVVIDFVSLAVLMYIDRRPLPLYIDYKYMVNLLRLGIPLSINALNVDMLIRGISLILGSVAGAVEVAMYNFATRLVDLPRSGILFGLSSYALPVFSRRYNNSTEQDHLKPFFADTCRYTYLILFPCFLGLALLAPYVVLLIFGEKWQDAIPILQVLSLLAAFSIVFAYVPALLIATKQPKLTVKAQLFSSFVALLVLSVFGGTYGAMAAALAMCAKYIFGAPFNLLAISKLLQVRLTFMFDLIYQSVVAGIVMTSVILSLQPMLGMSWQAFALLILSGIVSYNITLLIFDIRWPKKLKAFLVNG